MKLVVKPELLNRLLKIGVSYVNIRKSKTDEGNVDFVF
jgi:hypothetical protein